MPKALHGDRLWRITGKTFCCGLTEYNGEIITFAPYLRGIFGHKSVCYGGNATYLLRECVRRGYKVEDLGCARFDSIQ